MLKNFWYALAWRDEVDDEPLKARCLSQDLVLWRSPDGRAHAMSDVCVHRGGSLSRGWTKDGCIVCPYHAWRYDDEGACSHIPASGEGGTIPKAARIDTYPVKERYGWVWVFMGDLPEEERPPLPDFGPEFHDPAFRKVRGEWMWEANIDRVVENGVDVTHVNWVHSFGSREDPKIKDLTVAEYPDEYSAEATLTLQPNPRRGLWSKAYAGYGKGDKSDERPDVVTSTRWWMPGLVRIHVRLPMGNLIIYDANIPVDENTTKTLWTASRDFFTQAWADRNSIKRVEAIFQQDTDIVQDQKPELLPVDFAGELHHKTDACGVAYRKMRQKLIERGWGIDTDQMRSHGGRKYSVVPSPARREHPEMAHAWIMGEVPATGPRPVPDAAEAS